MSKLNTSVTTEAAGHQFSQLGWIKQAEELGVSRLDLLVHWRRIQRWGKGVQGSALGVVDSCRLDNGRIFVLPKLAVAEAKHVVAFVPAAGKGTRYLQAHNQEEDFAKALQPCVEEGHSFLDMKLEEHHSMGGLLGQVFVAPQGMTEKFQNSSKEASPPVLCLEQDASMSTIRFELDGTPARDHNGSLSLVPAGHGTLTKLFKNVKARFPSAKTLWIRNIDNINGTKPQAIKESKQFLALHEFVLDQIVLVRSLLAGRDYIKASECITVVMDLLKPGKILNPAQVNWLSGVSNPQVRKLWEALMVLFQAPIPAVDSHDLLQAMYDRPFHILGQVPNNGSDRGGAPVVVRDAKGEEFAICLEVAHACAQDQELFFSDPTKLTHFNPVFVAAEVPNDLEHFECHEEDPFWMIVKRPWHSRDVLIHETPLYEILGNTRRGNVLFVEISRNLFNPHKSPSDRIHRFWSDWVPAES